MQDREPDEPEWLRLYGVASARVTPTSLSRRRLLLAAAAVGATAATGLVTGCAGRSATAPSSLPIVPAAGPDDLATARRVAVRAAALAADVRTVARDQQRGRQQEQGPLLPLLGQVAARHDAHARAFLPEGERVGAGTDDPGGGTPGTTLRLLVRAEQRAGAEARTAALSAQSGDLARALASAAACLAQHVQLLGDAVAVDERGGRG